MLVFLFIKLLILRIVFAKENYEYVKGWTLFSYDIDGVLYTNDSDHEYKEGTVSFNDVVLEEHEKFLIRQNMIPYGYVSGLQHKISIPRTRSGIPFTVNYFDQFNNPSYSPALKPFPDSKTGKDLTSVFGMVEDSNWRLWFVDTGYLDYPGARIQVQPPALLHYRESKLQFRKDIDTSLLHNGITSGLRSLSVDFIVPYSETYVYITDDTTRDLIVFSLQDLRFTKIYRRSNDADKWPFWVPRLLAEYMLVVQKYRHPPNETYEHYVNFLKTKNQLYDVKSKRNREIYTNTDFPNYLGYLYTRNFDANILIFTNADRNEIFCWNMDTPPFTSNIGYLRVLHSTNRLVALDIVGNVMHGIMQNKLQNSTDKFSEEISNFWYFTISVDKLLEGSVCVERNQCTDYVKQRGESQTFMFFGRMRPKYVADFAVKNIEARWNVTGIMN